MADRTKYAKILTPFVSSTNMLDWAKSNPSLEEWRSVLFQIVWTLCAVNTLGIRLVRCERQASLLPNVRRANAVYLLLCFKHLCFPGSRRACICVSYPMDNAVGPVFDAQADTGKFTKAVWRVPLVALSTPN